MRERLLVRSVLVCLLLAFVVVLLVDYASRMDAAYTYPTGRELRTNFTAYHGQSVDVWVTVARRTPDGFVTARNWTVMANSLPSNLDAGDSVQVYGTARADQTIAAKRIVVTDSSNRRYMLAVSVVGLALAILGTLRYWRPAVRAGYFVPQPHGTKPDDTNPAQGPDSNPDQGPDPDSSLESESELESDSEEDTDD